MIDLDELIAEARDQAAYLRGVSRDGSMPYSGELLKSLADALEAATRVPAQGEPRDVREILHAKCDCVPDLGPAHCHLCSKDAPVAWEDCAAVSDAAGELVEVVLTTADIETLGHLLVQLSPVTQKNSGATIRRLLQEMNIKEVGE